jgi:predicted outer membrane protein
MGSCIYSLRRRADCRLPDHRRCKKFAAAAGKPLNDAWGELGAIAAAKRGEMPSNAQSAAHQKDLAELRKQSGDKFDKAYMKAFQKEAKRANAAFSAGAQSAQDPELKALFAKYQPIIAKLESDALAAEAEVKK